MRLNVLRPLSRSLTWGIERGVTVLCPGVCWRDAFRRICRSKHHLQPCGEHPGIFVEVNEGADRIEPLKIKREPYGSELLAG